MKNQLAKERKEAFEDGYAHGYEKAFQIGGFYYTALLTIAIHNLYRFRKAFDRIERECARLDAEANTKYPDRADRIAAIMLDIKNSAAKIISRGMIIYDAGRNHTGTQPVKGRLP